MKAFLFLVYIFSSCLVFSRDTFLLNSEIEKNKELDSPLIEISNEFNFFHIYEDADNKLNLFENTTSAAIYTADNSFFVYTNFPIKDFIVQSPDLSLDGLTRNIQIESVKPEVGIQLNMQNMWGVEISNNKQQMLLNIPISTYFSPLFYAGSEVITNEDVSLFSQYILQGNVKKNIMYGGFQSALFDFLVEIHAGYEEFKPSGTAKDNQIALYGSANTKLSLLYELNFKNIIIFDGSCQTYQANTSSLMNISLMSRFKAEDILFTRNSLLSRFNQLELKYTNYFARALNMYAELKTGPISPAGNAAVKNYAFENLNFGLILHELDISYVFDAENFSIIPAASVYYGVSQANADMTEIESILLPLPSANVHEEYIEPLNGDFLAFDLSLQAKVHVNKDLIVGTSVQQLIPVFINTNGESGSPTSTSSTSSSSNNSGGTRASLWIEYSFDAP